MAGRQIEYGLALEASSTPFNVYTKEEATTPQPRSTERVFISHRSLDKPIAAAIAGLLEELHLHYWFDRDDQDTQRAAALGMKGDLALVHAIDRGIRHSTRILGILSENTRLSWWVPYELGSARAVGIPASFSRSSFTPDRLVTGVHSSFLALLVARRAPAVDHMSARQPIEQYPEIPIDIDMQHVDFIHSTSSS
jgi:TIR domain